MVSYRIFFWRKTLSDAQKIIEILQSEYPDAHCELDYGDEFQLLVAVILSAQCTDKRVNKVTPALFERAGNPYLMADMEQEELEKYIFSCGFYRNKAKNIIGLSKMLLQEFAGEVPDSLENLVKLPGVGRKTANVVLNVIFNKPTMPVDTHLLRVSPKIGLAEGTTPEQVEKSLLERIPYEYMQNAHHWILLHGRYVCTAKNAKCEECVINDLCKKNEN
jgi:endonuclease-3